MPDEISEKNKEEKQKEKRKRIISFSFAFMVLVVFGFFMSYLITFPQKIKASSSIGTIDEAFKYAKGVDSSGIKIDFGLFRGSLDVTVTDSGLTGFAWGEKIGWINLSPSNGGVLNNKEGALSGFAYSEFGGWIDFLGVTIDSSGDFSGYATSEKFGKIIFNCSTDNSCGIENFKVKTDWRPNYIRNSLPMPKNAKIPLPATKPTQTPTPGNEDPEPSDGDPDDNIDQTKPLPITNLSQYEGEGDVIRYNKDAGKIENGKISTVDLSQNVSSGNENIPQAGENQNDKKNSETKNSSSIIKDAKKITSSVQNTAKKIQQEAEIVTNTPSVNILTKTVTTAGVAGGSTVVATTFFGGLASFSEILLTAVRLWSIILSAIGLKRRREPWGTVYDSITKQPLDPAYVVLKDLNDKEIATSITDLDGRYGFLVPPGKYRISVKKTNYIAPSLKLYGKDKDEVYDNLYFGEEIELGKEEKAIIKNIPMDPQGFDWNEFAKKDRKILIFHSSRSKILAQILNTLFYLGVFFSLGLIFAKPDVYNISIFLIYAILFFVRKTNVKHKSFGLLTEGKDDMPLSFAIVRIFQKGNEKESFHRVADESGHYYCLLPKGEYRVAIDKKNQDESYSRVYSSEFFTVKNGILNKDFKI